VERALALVGKTEAGARPVRLLGVSVHGLSETAAPASAPPDPGPPKLPFDE
jgi:hypothetical protein